MKFAVAAALPYYSWCCGWLLWGACTLLTTHPVATAAYDYYTTTSYAVLLAQARGAIPNAYGPVKAKVSGTLQLILQFNLLAGTGYTAGNVTATTDKNGHVVQLVKGKQTCKVTYNATTGALKRVNCTTRARRALGDVRHDPDEEGGIDSTSDAVGSTEAWDGGMIPSQRQLVASCGACISVVSPAFTNRTSPICGASFGRAIPAAYRWAMAAAASICALRTKLGESLDVAYKTCRCPCLYTSPTPCPSLICSQATSFCMAEKLRLGAGCLFDFDCVNDVCARRTLGSSPSNAIICCPSNQSISDFWGGKYCAYASEVGESCRGDWYCKSQICVLYHCATQRLGGGETCRNHDDCENRKCGYIKYPAGNFLTDKRCCTTNATTNFFEEYCTDVAEVGDGCASNSMCKSGVCSNRTCLSQKIAVGATCPDGEDADCANGVCDSVIVNGHWSSLCCPSNASSGGYCTNMAELGDECRSNEACKSGVCSNYTCIAKKHEINEPCPDGEDDDCQNGACGRPTYPDGTYVCCPTNRSTTSSTYFRYCDAIQSLGDRCDMNQQCKSGVCSNKTCIAQKIATNQPCPDRENDDCQNGACGRVTYPDGPYVCCPSNNVTDPDWRPYCTATQSLGDPCETNSHCVSGVCSFDKCIAERIEAGQPCSADDDCLNGACGQAPYYPAGPSVCCPSNRTTLAYGKQADGYVYWSKYCAATQGLGMPCNATELCEGGGSGSVVCSGGLCQSV